MTASLSPARRGAAAIRAGIMRLVLQRGLALDTDSQVGPAELGFANEEYTHYVPSQWPVVPIALRWRRPSAPDVFLDIGSGKGRVVLQAARYPFRRVVGLELSPALMAVARENLERNRARLKCPEIDLVQADFMNYVIPDDVTIVYTFHVLTGSAFQTLLDRMESLAARQGAPIHFIYGNPLLHDEVAARARIRLLKAFTCDALLAFPLHLYEASPPGVPGAPVPAP